MRYFFIANPISGGSAKRAILAYVRRVMQERGLSARIERTAYAGHAAVLATMAVENGYDVVVAIGGDGTVNEVARSLVGTSVALGIIPCGSGNGLARHLQIPLDYRAALEVLLMNKQKSLDYCCVNGRPFFCTCGLGFDAVVSYTFASSMKRGISSYMENTVREYTRFKPEHLTISDGETEIQCKAFVLACANASQYGNNAYIAPQASMSDGLMDITIIEELPLPLAPVIAYQLFNGSLAESSMVKMFRARRLHIVREQAAVIHLDGEPMEAPSVLDVELVPRQMLTLVNPLAASRRPSIVRNMTEIASQMAVQSRENLEEGLKQINTSIRRLTQKTRRK